MRLVFLIRLLENGIGFGDLFTCSCQEKPRRSSVIAGSIFFENAGRVVFRVNTDGDQLGLWKLGLYVFHFLREAWADILTAGKNEIHDARRGCEERIIDGLSILIDELNILYLGKGFRLGRSKQKEERETDREYGQKTPPCTEGGIDNRVLFCFVCIRGR